MKRALILLAGLVVMAAAVGVEKAKATFADLAQAQHLHGDVVKPEDLAGKVVFFEYWGVNCPPCRASFPHLVALQKKHAGSGKFTVLASHVQLDKEKAARFCQEQGANFPVYHQYREPAIPSVGYVPHAAIIDHAGKVVASGSPMGLLERVDEFVKLVPERYFMLGKLEIKHWVAQAKKLGADKPVQPVLAPLRQAADGTDAKAEEAKAMVAAIEAYLTAQRERLKGLVAEQPARAWLVAQNLRRVIAGTDGEAEVAETLATLQQNAVAVRVAGLLKRIDEAQARLAEKPNRTLTQQLAALKKQLEGIAATDATAAGVEAKAAAAALPAE